MQGDAGILGYEVITSSLSIMEYIYNTFHHSLLRVGPTAMLNLVIVKAEKW